MNPKSNKNLRLNEILLYTFSVATLGILFSGVIKKIEPNKILKKKLNILSYQKKKHKYMKFYNFLLSFHILKSLQDSLLSIVIIYYQC